MPDLFRVKGVDDFKRAAKVLREAGGVGGINGEVRKQLLRELRIAGKPAALAIRAAYRERMPKRGGLAERLGSAPIGVRTRLTGPSASTTVVMRIPGYDLPKIEEGDLRHPVFGHPKVWVSQDVPANVAAEAFEAMGPELDARVNAAIDNVIAAVEAGI